MKIFSSLLSWQKKMTKTKDIFIDYKQETLIKHGREQFEKLVKRGLSVPIALL